MHIEFDKLLEPKRFIFHFKFIKRSNKYFFRMTKPKMNQSQRRKARQAKAKAAALTGLPAAPKTGPRDGAVHRVTLPAARGQQSGLRKQVEMVVRHYHFHQQIVAGGIVAPNVIGGQNMSVPPPATSLSKPRVVQSHPKVLTPKTGHSSSNGSKDRTVARVSSDKPILTLWGSSHLAENHLLGPDLDVSLRTHFQKVINVSESGAKLTDKITERIEIAMRSHPGPNQVYVILTGGNNMRKTTKPVLEVAKLVSRFRRIMAEAQKAKVRVLLCGTIPDPRPAVDSKLKHLDEALKDLEMGQGNRFLTLRGSMLDAEGRVRRDLFKPNGDIHLNAAGTNIASLRIQNSLKIMLPNLSVQAPAPTQVQAPAPVVVNAPPVVNVPLVAPVVVQHVATVGQDQVESPMEVEDEDSILERLFFKKYGRALPEKEKEKDDVDNINFVIDLTEGTDEMEVATSEVTPVVVVKTEPIDVAEAAKIDANPNAPTAANVAEARKERRAFKQFAKSANLFAKKLAKEKESPKPNPTPKKVRKIRIAEGVDKVIPEKEAPTDSADPNTANTTEAEFEEDLIGIYAGPIGKIVNAPPKDVADDTNDASMEDAPPTDD
jgi:hypothetical protein